MASKKKEKDYKKQIYEKIEGLKRLTKKIEKMFEPGKPILPEHKIQA